MLKTFLTSVLFLGALQLVAQPAPQIEHVNEITVQNRILTKLNGKNISVLDVMKEMDVFLSTHYPQYMQSKTARFQFYSTQWKQTLQQMIDHELMVADAQSRDVNVSDGEVREEVHTRFGPNVMESLDKLGISYEEARAMVEQDMIVQRIQWVRVTSKALQKVTSQEIKNAYQNYLKENPEKEGWKYQFVTIRAADEAAAQALAANLVTLKEKAQSDLSVAAELFKAELPPESTATVSVSQEFSLESKELSQAHRDVLSQLNLSEWSSPIAQLSRDGTTVVRVFHLKDHTVTKSPTFAAMFNDLKHHLLNETADKENKIYVAKLRQRFNFNEQSLDLPPHFEPFVAH